MKQIEFINNQIAKINDKNYNFIYCNIQDPLSQLLKESPLNYIECLYNFCCVVSDKLDKNLYDSNNLINIFNNINKLDTNYYVMAVSHFVKKSLDKTQGDLSVVILESFNTILVGIKTHKELYLDLNYKICSRIIDNTRIKNVNDNTELVGIYVKNIEPLSKSKSGELVSLLLKKQISCINSIEEFMFYDSKIKFSFDELLRLNPVLYPESLKNYLNEITKYSNLNKLSVMYKYYLNKLDNLKNINEELYSEYIYFFTEKFVSNNNFGNEEFKLLFITTRNELNLLSKNNKNAYSKLCYKACISAINNEYKLNLHDKLIHQIFTNLEDSLTNKVVKEQVYKMFYNFNKRIDSYFRATLELWQSDILKIKENDPIIFNSIVTEIFDKVTDQYVVYNDISKLNLLLKPYLDYAKHKTPSVYCRYHAKIINTCFYQNLEKLTSTANTLKKVESNILSLLSVNPIKYIAILDNYSKDIINLDYPSTSGIYFVFFEPFYKFFSIEQLQLIQNNEIRSKVIEDCTPYYNEILGKLTDVNTGGLITNYAIKIAGQDIHEDGSDCMYIE